MSKILTSFTISRNILGRTTEKSAERLSEYIALVGAGIDQSAYSRLGKGKSNDISSFANYTGMFQKLDSGGYGPTKLNNFYQDLERTNRNDAWQWLISRTLWHYVIPNGTASQVSKSAQSLNIKFNFFETILRVLTLLSSFPGKDRFLYFHELCLYLENDNNWNEDCVAFFQHVVGLRSQGIVNRKRHLLGDLEDEFNIGRDNLNTVLVKAFKQTGLFEYIGNHGADVGIGLATDLSDVLQKRLRHILDSSLQHSNPETEWSTFIGGHAGDLPLEVEEQSPQDAGVVPDLQKQHNLLELCKFARQDFLDAGLHFSQSFIRRFFAACLTKPFVILTGLSGSGKTKLAEAAAIWVTSHPQLAADPFLPGITINADRTHYIVREADHLSIVLETEGANEDDDPKLTTLPRALIREWVDAIREEGFDRSTSSREIRDYVKKSTNHDPQINSFESHLKACAFALVEAQQSDTIEPCFKLIPVGPDWTSCEYVLGYPDALNSECYIRKPALDIILAAQRRPDTPHFLILDEMNLSHVERYFADILSAIETTQPIELYSSEDGGRRGSIPPLITKLPENLFIIGTVNVDETTYLFSPKVLDRANVLEFRISNDDLTRYMVKPTDIDLSSIAGKGAQFATELLTHRRADWILPEETINKLSTELEMLFNILEQHGSEFGYRVAKEISRFIYHFSLLGPEDDVFYEALDVQVCQKLLPKLNGSERTLKPILWAMAIFAKQEREWTAQSGTSDILQNQKEIEIAAREAMNLNIENPLESDPQDVLLPISYGKCKRMNDRLKRNGFTSFAEA